jgi:hypothetical protein
MMKNAFIDKNGVLTGLGWAASNNDDQLIEVPIDFQADLGTMQYVNGEWTAYTPPSLPA